MFVAFCGFSSDPFDMREGSRYLAYIDICKSPFASPRTGAEQKVSSERFENIGSIIIARKVLMMICFAHKIAVKWVVKT